MAAAGRAFAGAPAGGADARAAAEGVVLRPLDDGSIQVQAETYRARVGPDGNLHSIRIGEVEMLDDRIAISLGGFFYSDGPRRLGRLTRRAPELIHATDGTWAASYRFLPDEIRVSLTNGDDRPAPYFLVLSSAVAVVTRLGEAEAAAAPATEQWGDVRASERSGAFLELTGGDRVWGPWLGRQVWEISEVRPGRSREVRIRAGLGEPPQPALEQLVGVRTEVASSGALVEGGAPIELRVVLENRSDRTLQGLLAVELSACRSDAVIYTSTPMEMPARRSAEKLFRWHIAAPDFYVARVAAVAQNREITSTRAGIGYRAADIRPAVSRPPDFREFWEGVRAELGNEPLHFHMRCDLTRSRRDVEVWVVRYRSIAGKAIHGWYAFPEQARGVPAILLLSGYGARPIDPPVGLAGRGYAVLAIDVRGNRVDRVRPRPFEDYITEGILSPETYVYREIVGHALRGIGFLRQRPEADPNRIGVVGVSEGGGVGLILAALSPDVDAVAADAPMLCDLPLSARAAAWPYTEVARYLRSHPEARTEVHATLSYFDAANFARQVRPPVLLSVGFLDSVSLPAAVYGVYNLLPGPKEMKAFPRAGHEGGGDDMWAYKLEWLARNLAGPAEPDRR